MGDSGVAEKKGSSQVAGHAAVKEGFKPVQITTAFSDLVLALVCWYCVSLLLHSERDIEAGYLSVVALAATVGVLRFSGVRSVRGLHETLSMFGGQALSLLAIAFWTDDDGIVLGKHGSPAGG